MESIILRPRLRKSRGLWHPWWLLWYTILLRQVLLNHWVLLLLLPSKDLHVLIWILLLL